YRARFDAKLGRRKGLRGEIAKQRGDADRGKRGDRIAADDKLEAIESAAERRAEGAGDGRRRAAADQHAHVGATQAEGAADRGGQSARQLGVARFQADRSADTARPYG